MTMIDELRDLLEKEQSALLLGQYEKLEALADRKSELIARFNAQPTGAIRSGVAALKSEVLRNEELLEAAAKGLRVGLEQINALGKVAEQSTYSRSGKRRVLTNNSNSIEQKV